jgi:hypothetical protein
MHLSKSTIPLLELARADRARACRRDFWVEYPAAFEAMARAKALIDSPRGVYNPGMMVIGISGVGKSTMVRRWCDLSWEEGSSWAGRLIYVDMSEDTKELNVQKRLIEEIGKACGQPHIRSVRDAQRAIREFNIVGAVIDELGETEEASMIRRWKSNLLSIRGLAGLRWGLNLILVGVEAFAKTVKGTDQLKARFAKRCYTLKPWSVSEELAGFIKGCIRFMPFEQPSAVGTDVFLEKLVSYSVINSCEADAVADLRSMMDLFKESCRQSILKGREHVDENDLETTYIGMGGEVGKDEKSVDPLISASISL